MNVEAKYEVRYMIKKVHGVSHGITGELKSRKFFITVPLKSFTSGDSEQDSHMLQATGASLFPTVSAKGEFFEDHIKAEIEFHGILKTYQMSLKENGSVASFVLDLEAHGIKRPSLLGIKIKNEVLMTFKISQKS
jgi:hypothetical protein